MDTRRIPLRFFMWLFCLLLCFTSASCSLSLFQFDTSCSFRDSQRQCAHCVHVAASTSPYFNCTLDIFYILLPKPPRITSFFLSRENSVLNLHIIAFARLFNLKSFEIYLYWTGDPEASYVIHRSEVQLRDFIRYRHSPDEFGEVPLTFYGLPPHGIYDVQLVAHPNCGGFGVSEFVSFAVDNQSLDHVPDRSREPDGCPVSYPSKRSHGETNNGNDSFSVIGFSLVLAVLGLLCIFVLVCLLVYYKKRNTAATFGRPCKTSTPIGLQPNMNV